MKKVIIFCLFCLSLGLASSCDDLDNEMDKSELIPIEPPYEPMFQFDAQGIPYRLNSPTLSKEMQQNVQKEAFSHGWMWMQTFEIHADGFVNPDDYYKERFGASPSSYYIQSDKELVRYFWSDAIPAKAFLTQRFTMDTETGILSDGYNPSGLFPWSFYLRIWSVYKLNGRWYMDTIEPLGMRADENGEYRTVWGTSHYYRMSESELKQMQKEYSFDYSQVN